MTGNNSYPNLDDWSRWAEYAMLLFFGIQFGALEGFGPIRETIWGIGIIGFFVAFGFSLYLLYLRFRRLRELEDELNVLSNNLDELESRLQDRIDMKSKLFPNESEEETEE